MQMTIGRPDGVERAVVVFCQAALDADQSTRVDESVQSFRVYKNTFFHTKRVTPKTKITCTDQSVLSRDQRYIGSTPVFDI